MKFKKFILLSLSTLLFLFTTNSQSANLRGALDFYATLQMFSTNPSVKLLPLITGGDSTVTLSYSDANPPIDNAIIYTFHASGLGPVFDSDTVWFKIGADAGHACLIAMDVKAKYFTNDAVLQISQDGTGFSCTGAKLGQLDGGSGSYTMAITIAQ